MISLSFRLRPRPASVAPRHSESQLWSETLACESAGGLQRVASPSEQHVLGLGAMPDSEKIECLQAHLAAGASLAQAQAQPAQMPS